LHGFYPWGFDSDKLVCNHPIKAGGSVTASLDHAVTKTAASRAVATATAVKPSPLQSWLRAAQRQ